MNDFKNSNSLRGGKLSSIFLFSAVFILLLFVFSDFAGASSIVGGNCTVPPGGTDCLTSVTGDTNGLQPSWVGQLFYSYSKTGVGTLDPFEYPPNSSIYSEFLTDVNQFYTVTLVTHNPSWSKRIDYGPVTIQAFPPPTPTPAPTPVNTSPTITVLSGNQTPLVAQNNTYSVVATDPDAGATLRYVFDWGDGQISFRPDPCCSALYGSGQNVQADHAYLGAGNYTLTVTAFDNQGAASTPVTLSILVPTTQLHINCCTDTFFNETDHPWPIYVDGEATNYGITNGSPDSYILWSSSKGGVPVINNCYYGQITNPTGGASVPGGVWTLGDVNPSWTQTVSFTNTQPVLNSCNNTPTNSNSASATFSVQPHVVVTFDVKMDDGAGEFSLNNSAIHYNYSSPYVGWHNEDIQSGFTRFLLRQWWSASFPAPPSSFPYPGYLPTGYNNAALVGITDEGGSNIWVGGATSNKFINAGSDAFTAHYRNTRIKVLSNQANLGGTYSITPNSVATNSNNLNTIYKGMTANSTYTLTYTPGVGEIIVSISTQLCGGGYPIEICNAPNTTSGASASQLQNFGGLIIFTLNITKTPPPPPPPNQPPSVSAITITEPDYCVSGPAAFVSWAYSDPDGNPQSAFQVQVDDQGSFNSPEADSGKVISSGISYFTGDGVPPWAWGITYKARVRAWDSNDAASTWTESDSWKTPKHPFPAVNFTWFPFLNPSAKKPVQFTDQTHFFDDSTPVGQRSWGWLFGDGGSSAVQNPIHTYSTFGSYSVSEAVTDKDGYNCSLTKLINIDRPIPVWKEVGPK